jgi:hypothetical protein
MPLTRHITEAFDDESVTTEKFAANVVTATLKFSNVVVTNSSWSANGSSTISTTGGYFLINGNNMVNGVSVLIDTTPASAVTFVSSSQVRVTAGAKSAGAYWLYLVNPDGGTAIKVNGITYA